jgi:hypothetical protein
MRVGVVEGGQKQRLVGRLILFKRRYRGDEPGLHRDTLALEQAAVAPEPSCTQRSRRP